MTLLSILDRYIARHVLMTIGLTLLVLLGLGFVGLFMANLGNVGKADYGYGTLLAYVMLNMPMHVYEIFPAAALVGTSAGLSILAMSSELTAMRAGTVSLRRIVLSVSKVCLILLFGVILLGEWLAPRALQEAERLQATALHQPSRTRVGNLWLRDEGGYVRIGEVMPDGTLRGIDLITTIDGYEHLTARVARFDSGHWQMRDVRRTRVEQGVAVSDRLPVYTWESGFGPDLIGTMRLNKRTMTSIDLYRYVHHLKDNKQDAAVYELTLWNKLVLPFSTLVMVMLAIPFVFGSVRSGGLGRRVFIGVMIGIFFGLMQTAMGYYSLSFGVAPVVASLTPSVLFFGLTLYLFHRVRRV